MSVRILRLINNEEVIGKVELPKGKSGNFVVKNGAVLVPAGEGRIAVLPWLPHAKDSEIEIPKESVVIHFTPLDELANEIFNCQIKYRDLKNVKPIFKLHPPSKGFKGKTKKSYGVGGELGPRGEQIDSLLKRMI